MNTPDKLPTSAAESREAAAAATEQQTRWWARLLHCSVLAGFLGCFIIGPWLLIAPIAIWHLKKTALPGIVVHGKNGVNWLISAIIYAVVGVILMVVISFITLLLVGAIESLVVFWYGVGTFLLALVVLGIIFPIVAAIKANHGTAWKYPLAITFLK